MLKVLLSYWNEWHAMVVSDVEVVWNLVVGYLLRVSGNEGHQSTDFPNSQLTQEENALQLTASVGC